MPKSKRRRALAPANKTAKKTRESKERFVAAVRDCLPPRYRHVYVVRYGSLRNAKLKEVRADLAGTSRLCLGSNGLLGVALGRTAAEAAAENLHLVAECLRGNVGVLFSNAEDRDTRAYFDAFRALDFARAGHVADRDVGVAEDEVLDLPAAVEPRLRALGLPVALRRGDVVCTAAHRVCGRGDVLTPEQCKQLEHLGVPLAAYRLPLLCHWDAETSRFEQLRAGDDEDEENEEEEKGGA